MGGNPIQPTFQNVKKLAILLPESFRGGCSFGAKLKSSDISSASAWSLSQPLADNVSAMISI